MVSTNTYSVKQAKGNVNRFALLKNDDDIVGCMGLNGSRNADDFTLATSRHREGPSCRSHQMCIVGRHQVLCGSLVNRRCPNKERVSGEVLYRFQPLLLLAPLARSSRQTGSEFPKTDRIFPSRIS
jgi:hypothetical protein